MSQVGQVKTSQDMKAGTFGKWDTGQCPRWDRLLGHPGISQDVKGHLGPGTLGNILGGTG